MKLKVRKRKIKSLKKRIQVTVMVVFIYLLWTMACRGQMHFGPTEPETDICKYLSETDVDDLKKVDLDDLTQADYDIIFAQTGVGRAGIETLVENDELSELENIQDYYYGKANIYESRYNVIRHQERVSGVYKDKEKLDPHFIVEDGDILVTLSSYVGGWRYDHTGLVVDAKAGTVLEAMDYGEPSVFRRLGHWREYPAFAILRPKDLSEEERAAVAEYAYDNLENVDYGLLSTTKVREVGKGDSIENIQLANELGIKLNSDVIEHTQCAHIVWYAYYLAGIDLSDKYSVLVTPADILQDDDLELVMEYGFRPDIFQGRR
ncbi:MAG: hypothetical protein K6B67_07665 [Lachnospiraceae bacterium]|nr:hypothetical protein [Lachnospiraceae bacterium]